MRSLIRLPAGLTGCAFVLAMLPGPAAGQDIETLPIPILEVSAGYTYMHDTGLEKTFPVGWYLSGAVNVTQWFGIVAEGGGSYASTDVTYWEEQWSQKQQVHAFLAGGRFFHKSGRVVPFGQMLAGYGKRHVTVDHMVTGGPYHGQWQSRENYSALALQPGGGVTVLLTENVGVRAAVDYRWLVDFTNEDQQGELRILTGFSFHWGRR